MKKDEAKERIEMILAYMESLDADEEEVKDIDALNTAIKALEESRWIPVTERLPEKGGLYFVTKENDYGKYVATEWFYQNGTWSTGWKVIAWMELPKPYEEGEDE